MRISLYTAVMAGALAVLGGRTVAFSQVPGDTVRALAPADLKIQDAVVATVPQGDVLQVRKVSGNWLWVQTADGGRGWLLKEQVQLVPNAASGATPAKPEQNAPETPQPPRPRAPAAERGRVKPVDGTSADAPWLATIGVLAGQNVYTTYAYIGAVADGLGNSTYTAEQVQQLMAEVSGMMVIVRQHLQAVRETTIVDADRAAIDEVLSILTLLSDEADALARFAQSGADADLAAYDKARTTVWPKLKAILEQP